MTVSQNKVTSRYMKSLEQRTKQKEKRVYISKNVKYMTVLQRRGSRQKHSKGIERRDT